LKCFAFDRDGTLIWGEGPISRQHLLKLRGLGYYIGGSGAQHTDEQYRDWRENGIEPDFAVHKFDLASLKDKYDEITHVGDTQVDMACAQAAGFGYMTPTEFVKWLGDSKF
jgi:phosphoglycolate phosphatase-like HAD superfamily hydrolase